MNDFILAEVNFFFASFIFGVLLFLAYDILVILRNTICHAKFLIAIEDIGFWIIAGILIFCLMYIMNNGTIRYYATISVIIGMKLYQVLLSKHVVHIGSLVGTGIKKLMRRFFRFISTPLRFLLKQLKKCVNFLTGIIRRRIKLILNFVKKQLKIRREKVKIKKREYHNQKHVEQIEPAKVHGVLELITLSGEKGESYEQIKEKEKKWT